MKLAAVAKPASAPLSAEREELAVAIARQDEARRAIKALDKAIEDARSAAWAASRAADAAEEVAATAAEKAAEYTLNKALGREEGDPPISAVDAQAAVAAAGAKVNELRALAASLQALIQERAANLSWAGRRVEEMREAVIKSDPKTVEIMARQQTLARELSVIDEVLSALRINPGWSIRPTYLSNDSPWRSVYASLLIDATVEFPAL